VSADYDAPASFTHHVSRFTASMTFLPLIERELRLRARSSAGYWTRFAVGMAGVLICLPQLTSAAYATATIGRGVFNGLVSAAFLVICGVCLLTVGALETEQREGTLGLLLLTRVRVLDVLLGKLGSIGLTSVCVLVAFLPMLMLPVLSGGVSGGEVLRKELGLLNTLLFALAAGLFASACQKEHFKAARLAVLIVGTITLVPFLAGVMLGRSGLSTVPPLPVRLSPLVLLISAGDLPYRASRSSYWFSMVSLSAVSCVLLVGACVRLRRAVRGEGHANRAPEWFRSVGTWVGLYRVEPDADEGTNTHTEPHSRTESRAAQPRRRHAFAGQTSPVAWRVSRQRGLRAAFWAAAFLGFLYYGLFGFVFRFWGVSSVALASWSFNLASAAVTGALCAWAASRFFVETRRTGELEVLLTTPVGARTIVSDQWKVLRRVIRWPLVLMLAPMLFQVLTLWFMLRGPSRLWRFQYMFSIPLSAINTVLALIALCWMALWFGLRAGSQARAILWSVGIAKALPYGVAMVCSLVASVLMRPGMAPFSLAYFVVLLLPQVATLAFNLWLIRLARRRLAAELTAAQPALFALRPALSSKAREAVAVIRAARHWTPS
jgi:hypothetical protein